MNVIVVLCDTLRRDHCGPYHHGMPLNHVGGTDQPDWVVPTQNLDRLAAKGTVFDNCFTGSTPCMPARRDLYTGAYEFLRRGWGPLEDDDPDLPRQISPRPTKPIQQYEAGEHVSYLVTDHLCLWTNGAGNYHMNYSGFDFIRGNQEDPWITAPVDFEIPDADRRGKLERYFRNKHFFGSEEKDSCIARVMTRASEWLELNHTHQDFYLHIDSYDPHEPWDPPEELVKMFDPKGYVVEGWSSHTPFIVYHPDFGHGERRQQLVQNVDVYCTVLEALGKPAPEKRDGVSLIPVLRDRGAKTRDYAIMGQFGQSISITDGEWTLHQPPDPRIPLYWYSHHLSRFYRDMELGPFEDGRRRVLKTSPPRDPEMLTTVLSNRTDDPTELENLAEEYPEKVDEMRRALKQELFECAAPSELLERFQLSDS